MTRILAMGDLHLEKRRTHEREPGDGLADQAEVLAEIRDRAIELNVDAVVNAGDTFEGPTLSPAAIVVYADFVAALHEQGIPILTALGNGRHDLAMRDVQALRVFDHTPGIETFTRPALRIVGDTTLCMLPWVHPGRLVAEAGGGDRDEIHETAAQLLLRAARDLYDAAPTARRVLVFHGKLEGAAVPTGLVIDSLASDIVPLDDLAAIGFDAVVAADIHVPQYIGLDSTAALGWVRTHDRSAARNGGVTGPVAVYTGSPMPLDFGEGGYEHGVWLVDVGEMVRATFLPIHGRRFVTVDVDLTTVGVDEADVDETDAIAAAIAERLPLDGDIVRVRIRGTEDQARRVDTVALKVLLDDAHKSYLQFDTVRANRARVDGIDEDIAPLDAVDLYAAANDLDEQAAAALRDDTARYLDRIGGTA